MRRTKEGALCRPESRKLEAEGEGSMKTETRECLAWCLFGFGSEGGGMRKQCFVGLSNCVVLFIRPGVLEKDGRMDEDTELSV